MGGWRYEVGKASGEFMVVEVYTDEDGNIEGWCEAGLCSDTLAGLRLQSYELGAIIEEARTHKRPVIDLDDITNRFDNDRDRDPEGKQSPT